MELNKRYVIALALVAAFSFSEFSTIALAKDKRQQCEHDERWDKELKRCVVQGGS